MHVCTLTGLSEKSKLSVVASKQVAFGKGVFAQVGRSRFSGAPVSVELLLCLRWPSS